MLEFDNVDERIIRVVRKHWFVLLANGLFFIIMLILPLILWALLPDFAEFGFITLAGPAIFAKLSILFGWLTLLWMAAFLALTDYILDVLVITDKRIFDIEQMGLFKRESTTFRIDRIQDVTVEVKGVIATFLDFGRITIETASDNADPFTINMIGHPYEIKKLINEEIDRSVSRSQAVHVVENEARSNDPVPMKQMESSRSGGV